MRINIMEITLLGVKLEDYPKTKFYEEKINAELYSDLLKDSNIKAFRFRLSNDFDEEIIYSFLMRGNYFITTEEIIAQVRVALSLNLLTEEEWVRAIPLIEFGLKANKDYVKMLDEMSPILEKYCKKYKKLNMRNTFHKRVNLECWQGRFSDIWDNPEQKPNYY